MPSFSPPPADPPAGLVALNRFGLGARPGEAGRVPDRAAARRRLLAEVGADPGFTGESTAPALPTRREISEVLAAYQEAQQGILQSGPEGGRDADFRDSLRRLHALRLSEESALLAHRLTTPTPFAERMVAFWSNHLCISHRGRPPVAALAGLYEREVVRPHLWGSFADMVLASARHPAMLLYLDQARSVGPGSPLARTVASRQELRATRLERRGETPPPARSIGLNENYARELLELHTLGVDGGYTQDDVEALARLLTGWSVGGPGAIGVPAALLAQGPAPGGEGNDKTETELGFVFRPGLHDPDAQVVLGRRYRGVGRGNDAVRARDAEARGEAVIRDLCAHPATARFVAGKLARHFLGDAPDPDAVETMADCFHATGGDLAEVARTLLTLDAPWHSPGPGPERRKLRSPQDWVVASLRALDPPPARAAVAARGLAPLLEQLRHPLWAPPSPAGYGDALDDWGDPDALRIRSELARTLAGRFLPGGQGGDAGGGAGAGGGGGGGRGGGAGVEARIRALASVVPTREGDPLHTFLSDPEIPPVERVALLLAAPAFQWR